MNKILRSAFLELPYCLATYVCLIGAGLLLFNPFTPPKIDPSTYLVHNPKEQAELTAAKLKGRAWNVSYTGSMKPLLKGGEYVVTVGEYEKVKEGMVLVYSATYHDKPIIHRAVQKDKYGFIMAGDSSPISESWSRVTSLNYLGTAIAIYKKPE